MAATRLEDAIGWLSGQRAAMESFLERLVLQNSFTANRRGVEAVANLAAGQLRSLALDVELRASQRFGPHVLFATGGGGLGPPTGRGQGPSNSRPAGAPVYLVGHTDTVHPPGAGEGFLREGDRGIGPGAADMKGGVAVLLHGLAAAKRAGLLERVALRGALVSDAGLGSPESQALLRAHAAGAAAGLCFDAGRPGDLLITSREGGGTLEAEARGLAALPGEDPGKGRSAVWAMARFIDRVQGLADAGRGLSVNVGVVAGGTSPRTVAAEARCELDLRFPSPEDGRALVDAVRAAAVAAAVPGTGITVEETAWREPLAPSPGSSALAKAYGECQRRCGLGMGEAPRVGSASDACTLGAMGIPVVDGLGARGRGFHGAREEVDLSSLVPKATALLRFLALRAGA